MIPATHVGAAIFPFFPLGRRKLLCLYLCGDSFVSTNNSTFQMLEKNSSTFAGDRQTNRIIVAAKIYLILVSFIKSTRMKLKMITALLIITTATGCYYDNEEELYNCSIDAANIRYATTINSLFTSYGCIGCHGSLAPSGNIMLNTYAGVKAVALNGRLHGAINHAPGYEPMPQGSGKMNACDIKKIKAWIDAGAPNN